MRPPPARSSRSPAGGRPAGRPPARAARGARLATLVVLAAAALAGCDRATGGLSDDEAAVLTGGDPARGRRAIQRYGCSSCHSIAGVPGAHAQVGPPLDGIGSRAYLAGVLTNTPRHLVRWIRDPQGVDSLTAMPDMGVTERDARDIAAYLYSRR